MTALVLLLLAGDVVELSAPEGLEHRAARDLNGDSVLDLVLVTPREAWVWLGGKEFGSEPDKKLALPEGACLFDFVRFGGKGETLVVRTARGYFAVPIEGKTRDLGVASGPGLPRAPGGILWRELAADLDGDEAPDFVDVSLEGYRVTFAAGGSRVLPPLVHEEAQTSGDFVSERHVARYAPAMWAHGFLDGGEGEDVAVVGRSQFLLYPGADPASRVELGFLEEGSELTFSDLNGDGRTDVLAVNRFEGRAVVHLAHAEDGIARASRTRLAVRGTMRHPVLADFDGDGLSDLALPYFPTPSVQDAVRWFLRGEVLIRVPVFLNRGGRDAIPETADTQVTIPIRIRVSADAAGRFSISGLVVAEYEGDFDGDGRKDLLLSRKPDELAVHRGVPGRVFAEDPERTLAVPDAAAFDQVASKAADLDGDGRDEVVLHYRAFGRRPDRVFLLRLAEK